MKNVLLLLIAGLLAYLAYDRYISGKPTSGPSPRASAPQTNFTPAPTSESSATPAPKTPAPTSESVATPAPTNSTPKNTPSPAPEPVLTTEQEALQWLEKNASAKPAFVTLAAEHQFPLLMNGRKIGKSKVAAGTSGKVISWRGSTVTVEFAGGPRDLAMSETDFMARVMETFRSSKSTLNESHQQTNNSETPVPLANKALTPAKALDTSKQVTATALAEYCDANRSAFAALAGTPVQVNGVVHDITLVPGSIGAETVVQVSLKTRPDLPKVRLMIRASDFLTDESDYDRIETRINNKALEMRTRDNRDRRYYSYYYWYYYNGYWQRRLNSKTEWVRVLYEGAPVNASGSISKFHIHVDLEGANIDKGIAGQ